MPIVPPLLDDRTWQDLRDEALARVPIYTPEWTDLRPGDPGVTLVELFAYLTEALIYRLNRVPDNSYIAFLNLLDAAPRPAEPASGIVQLAVKGIHQATLSAGARVRAGKVRFSTKDSLAVLPIDVAGYLKCRVNTPAAKSDARAYADAALFAYRISQRDKAKELTAVHYATRAYPPTDGSIVPLSRAIDGALWVAILARKEDVETPADMAAIRALLAETRYLSIGVAPAGETKLRATHCEAPDDPRGNRAVSGAPQTRWRWEISAPAGIPNYPTALGWEQDPTYRRVKLISDTTHGLRQPGVIKLELPDQPVSTWDLIEPAAGVQPVPIGSFPRAGDMPPFLDDGDVEKRVIAWLRALPVDAAEDTPPPERPRVPGALSFLGANVVNIVQSVRQLNERIGVGNGQPGQQLALSSPPVIAGSLRLNVLEDGAHVQWTEVQSFDASDERSSVFVLDRALGLVTVGDGLRGRVLPGGAQVTASVYDHGGGLAGNLPAGALRQIEPAPGDDISRLDSGKTLNPIPTTGGSETETVDQARRRVPMILRHQNRAVTADDFRELASLTPGVSVGRAEVLPLYRPGTPATQKVPGAVSVLVIPSEDAIHPRAPRPDRNFREAVCRHLDRHRLITTELHIIGPRYVPIAVSIGVQPKAGVGIETLTNWVCLALHQFLAPLPPFGPDGAGWPLGGRINRAAIEAAVLQVDGVAWVDELKLYRIIAGSAGDPVESIDLGVTELPELLKVDVDLNHAPAPDPPSPIDDQIPVPVPAPRGSC